MILTRFFVTPFTHCWSSDAIYAAIGALETRPSNVSSMIFAQLKLPELIRRWLGMDECLGWDSETLFERCIYNSS